MTSVYKIRISIDTHFNILTQGISQYAFCVENPDTNVHLHYILYTDLTVDTIRKRIKSHPEYTKGNSFYSLKTMNPLIEDTPDEEDIPQAVMEQYPHIRYEAYIMKQGNHYFHGYTEQHQYIAQKFDTMIKQEIKQKKQDRMTQLQHIQSLEPFVSSKKVDNRWLDPEGCCYTHERIVDIVYAYFANQEKLIREFQLVSLILTLCAKYVPSWDINYKRYLIEKTCYKHF